MATVRAFLAPPTRGIVLETFGAGNAPQSPELMTAFKQACDSGIVIVAITQCLKGSVSDAYQTGRALRDAGIVPGGDMTPEVLTIFSRFYFSKLNGRQLVRPRQARLPFMQSRTQREGS